MILKEKNKIDSSSIRIVLILALFLFMIAPVFLGGDHSSSFRDVIPAFVLLIFSFYCYGITIKVRTNMLLLIAFWFFSVVSTFISGVGFDSTIITSFLFVVFAILITSINYSKKEINIILNLYVIICSVSALLIFLSVLTGKSYSYNRFSIDCIGIHKNPNYVTGFIMGGYGLLLHSVLFKKQSLFKRLSKLLIILLMLVSFVFSGTRAAILASIIVFILCVVINLFKSTNKLRSLVVGLLLMSMVIIFYLNIDNFLPDFLVRRLSSDNIFESDDIRLVLWSAAYERFSNESFIFGLGINGTEIFSHSTFGLSLHSVILQLLFDTGAVGVILVLFYLLSGLLKEKKITPVLIVFTISMLIPLMFQNGLYAISFWFFIIFFKLVAENRFGGVS